MAVRGPVEGDATEPPEGWDALDPKTGAPAGIDKGWAYAPGAEATTPLYDLVARKLESLPAPLGAAMWQALAPAVAMERELAWWRTLELWLAAEHAAKRQATVGALDDATLDWLAARGKPVPASAEIAVRDTVVRGAKQRRHKAAQDALSETEWRALPAMLDAGALYYDHRSGNLVFVADGLGPAKAAVRFRPGSGDDGRNLVVSAFRVDDATVAVAVKGGEWEIVRMAGGSRTRISGE